VLKGGGYSFAFDAPSAGQLSSSWSLVARTGHVAGVLIASARTRIANGGRVEINVALTRRGRALMAAARQLKLTATATFTPPTGPGISARAKFTLSG
jgi:hypothetical protein